MFKNLNNHQICRLLKSQLHYLKIFFLKYHPRVNASIEKIVTDVFSKGISSWLYG